MHIAKTLFLAVAVSLAVRHSAAAGTVFVKSNASGANNGTSWANAYTDLQSALATAVATDEIWVAAGIYKPTATSDRTISFALKNGVGIYGGFVGTETMRSQRNLVTNVTIFSGDIGTVGVATDNSYHVVTSDSTVTATGILDGFTVTSGRADGPGDPADRGGGAYVNQGSPTFVRVIFSDNHAGNRGGGVRVAAGSPSFTNCRFQGNTSVWAGGGLSAASVGSLQIRSCVFRDNFVNNSTGGGAIEATDNTTITNSELAQNYPNAADLSGPNNSLINSTVDWNGTYGVWFGGTGNVIINSIVWPVWLGSSGAVSVTYSSVPGGFAGTGNNDTYPTFVDPPADLRLAAGSTGIDGGNNAAVPGGVTTDVAGLPRFFDDSDVSNTGVGTPPIVDMGAHERIPLSVSAPTNQTICAGNSVSFSVTVSGAPPLSYRWRRNTGNLSDGGSISGATTSMLTINPTAAGDSGSFDVVVTDGFSQTIVSTAATLTVNSCPASFFTVTPCRIADTRDSDGPYGGPALSAGVERSFVFANRCGIPSTAKAVSLNVTVTQPAAPGHVILYPGGSPAPTVSAINFRAGQTRANNAIVPLGVGGTLAVQSAAPTHFILDVNGYFE